MAEPAHDEPDSPSDATTTTEVDGDDSLPTLPSAKQVLTYIPGFIWRVVVPAVVLTIFLNIPFSERTSSSVATLVDVLFMTFWGVAFLFYFVWQIRSIHKSGRPEARWIESLIVLGIFFLTIFARSYRILTAGYPHAFSQPMDTLNSYYYALGILSTAGDGTLVAVSNPAKIITMLQIVADLALIGLLVRVLAGAATRARKRMQK